MEKQLSQFKIGEEIIISRINCGRIFSNRLSDLGLFEGTSVEIIKNNNSCPIVIQIMNSKIALGQGEAHKIYGKIL
jgi:Fe2+ transport system protein FeoA